MSKTRGTPLLFGLVAGSLIVGLDQAVFYWCGVEPTNALSVFWPFIFSILLALWIEQDSRGRSNVYRTFDFGFLVYFTSIFYAPYYLWRTRGKKGAVAAIGLVSLAFLGSILAMAIHVAR